MADTVNTTYSNYELNASIYLSSEENSKYSKEDIINAVNRLIGGFSSNNEESGLCVLSFEDESEGKVYSKDEFIKIMQKYLGNSDYTSELSTLYDILNTDGKEGLTQEELSTVLDSNGDNQIMLSEILENITASESTLNQALESAKTKEGITKLGTFQNEAFRAEIAAKDMFGDNVRTYGEEYQRAILRDFISDFVDSEWKTNYNSEGVCWLSRENSDGSTDAMRVVEDGNTVKVICTHMKNGSATTSVFGANEALSAKYINGQDIEDFELPSVFSGSEKEKVKYNKFGEYYVTSDSNLNNINSIIGKIYGISASSDKGKLIYDALLEKNPNIKVDSSGKITGTQNITLLDERDLLKIKKKMESGELFSSDVEITTQYVSDHGTMPYLIIGPKNPDPNKEYPTLVYLHGMAENGVSPNLLLKTGLGQTVTNWDMQNFNGYIIMPMLAGRYNTGEWCNQNALQYVSDVLKDFESTHNVDKDNVAIAGHSLGGMGAIYFAKNMQSTFSKCAVLSGYNVRGVNVAQDINIPIRGYTGNNDEAYRYMAGQFQDAVGADNVYVVNTYHGDVPRASFTIDSNGDNCSDLLQWLFT